MPSNRNLHKLLRVIFPEVLMEYFEISGWHDDSVKIEVWLDEKNYMEHSDYKSGTVISHGFTDEKVIQDFPLRGKPVYLHVRRRRWYDKATGETFSYTYDDLTAEGTKLTPEFVAFFKKKIETTVASISSIADAYGVKGKQLTSQYKGFISAYRQWDQLDHASEYVLFKQNIGPSLCIDETSLSCGELYTVVTNRAGRGGKGTLVAMIRGTKSEDVIKVLEMIHVSKRKTAKEVTLDLLPTMMRIV